MLGLFGSGTGCDIASSEFPYCPDRGDEAHPTKTSPRLHKASKFNNPRKFNDNSSLVSLSDYGCPGPVLLDVRILS